MKTAADSAANGSKAAVRPAVARPRPQFAGPRAVASLVPSITRKAFEKHGFAAASLITDWASIVGVDMARLTRPERLKWPRVIEKFSETDDGARGRPGATLTIRVDPAAALDVQYQRAQLIERINAYFGYRAVAEVKLVQAGDDSQIGEPPRAARNSGTRDALSGKQSSAAAATEAATLDLSTIEDEGLRAALTRLAASVAKGAPD